MHKALVTNIFLAALLLSSCASNKLYANDTVSAAYGNGVAIARPAAPWEYIPPPSDRVPPSPEKILGDGKTDSTELANFLLKTNPFLEEKFARDFAKLYIEEAAIEGVNHDVAFSQMCLETGFLSFGGLVKPEMNNYAGIGSTGPDAIGEYFSSPRIGVRAQIQHLKAYATGAPLNQENVDPRRHFVRPGSATTIYQLAGSWAEDKEYGHKIKVILDRLYALSFAN
jgi:hypothetical protein